MGEDLLKELYGLRKKIMFMPKSIKRDYLLLDYAHLYKYMEYLNISLNEDLLDFDNIDRVNKITNDGLRLQMIEFVINNKFLLDKINEILNTYYENNFYATNYLGSKIKNDEIGDVLKSFFKDLGEDIFNLYRRFLEETMIGYSISNDANALTFHRMFDKISNVIMCNNGDELIDYNSLVHEIGHVYQFYLQRNSQYLVDIHYGTEITSRLFEKLFRNYLIEHHLYPYQINNVINSYHCQNINLYAHCSLISEIIKSGNYFVKDNYVFTNFDKQEIKEKLEEKCGYVYDYLLDLDYANFLYIIGDIISSNFYEKIIINQENGMKELKDFLVNLHNYNVVDSLKLYGNISCAKKNITDELDKMKILRKGKKYG